MSSLPSASRLELAAICLGSAVLPGVEYASDYAALGSAKHRFLERALTVGRDAALAEVPEEHRQACAELDLNELPAGQPGAWAAEVAYAFDVMSAEARELGRGLGRKYAAAGLRPEELPGTIDLVGVTVDGSTAVVVDYKTGHKAVRRAAENRQLRFAALCAARTLGKQAAKGAVLYVDADGTPRYDWADFDAFELDVISRELEDLGSAVLAMTPERVSLVVGSHCAGCPAVAHCPENGAFVRRLVADGDAVERELEAAINQETAAQAYERIQAVRAVLGRVEQALFAYAAKTPVPLPNGEVLGEVETSREALVGPVVRQVLSEKYGQDVAEASVEYEATKASVERGLRIVALSTDRKITHLKKEAFDFIRAAKGVTVKTSSTVRAHKPKAPELSGG